MKLLKIPKVTHQMYVLKLEKPLYGLIQASSNWYEMLKKALEDCGFLESVADFCGVMKKDMIVLVYVDDCILISNTIAQYPNSLSHYHRVQRNSYLLTKENWTSVLALKSRRIQKETASI